MNLDMFDEAEAHNMVNQELVAYSESQKWMCDYRSALEYVRKESLDDGVSKGIENGREEERVEGRAENNG
ncbi:MAG: hypothetical protein K2L45_02825 [Muribaculaceae bacterium]|nr:hypothetical protein [Muribaculaceae bacterium]